MANVIGTLKFNLDEPESSRRHARAVRSDDAYILLWDIDQMLRGKLKYDDLPDGVAMLCEDIRTKIADTGLMEIYE